MAMGIQSSQEVRNDYAEQIRERQEARRTEEAKEAENAKKAENAKEAESTKEARTSAPQDAYISREQSGERPNGLYRVGQDENGRRKIFYEDPKKARPGEAEPAEEEKKVGEPEKKEEICVGNTDKVDREIRKLREKRQQLEQQIRSASGDERKRRELEQKLAQVTAELSQKDNDTYRRQHTSFSSF